MSPGPITPTARSLATSTCATRRRRAASSKCARAGPQGSALTCIVFPILLDGILKETERRFPGVETKAIQDDVDLYGDPAIILGEGGALDFILAESRRRT